MPLVLAQPEVSVRLLVSVRLQVPELPLVLIQGVPKGEKADFLVQKCVELGVTGIIPAVTERTVVKFSGDADREKKRERWQRIATEAAKQSGRGAVPEITKPVDFRDLMGALEPDWLKIIPYENEEERTLRQVLREYFPEDYTTTEMRNVIEDLLTDWKRRQENEGV